MKLRWAQLSGGSEKQFGDAASIYDLQLPVLDLEYMKRWVGDLGVEALWKRMKQVR